MKRPILVLVLLWPPGAMADCAAGAQAYKRGDSAMAVQQRLEPTFGTNGK